MKKYNVIMSTDPYHASRQQHCEEVAEYNGNTPVAWYLAKGVTLDEAFDKFDEIAENYYQIHDDCIYYDNDNIAEWKKQLIDEGMNEQDADVYLSWYQGNGYYEYWGDDRWYCLYRRGDTSLRADVICYSIQECE